jgi:inhibitor of cysteine peptidase
MPSASHRRWGLLILTVLTITLTAGCPPSGGGGGSGGGDEGPAALEAFASGDELLSYFRTQALAQSNANRGTDVSGSIFGSVPLGGAAPAPEVAPVGADTAGQTDGSTSYSTTNIQEEGVDESDVFKSDGVNFYIAKGKTLRIVRATPTAEMEEIAKVEFDNYIESLYLVGDQAIVLAEAYGNSYYGGPMPMRAQTADVMMWPPYYVDASVSVAQVDISDPAAAGITKQMKFDGSLVASRVTNNRLILVLTIAPTLPDNPTVLTLAGLTLNNVLPKMHDNAGAEGPMVPPENWYHPVSPDGYFTTAVMTLDASDIESVVGSVAVMANAGTIYASTEALYLTNTDYTLDNQYRETTAVHKLAFDADGVAQYAASGTVPGRLLNQFSLGELDGYLRLATHISNFGGWVEGSGGGVVVDEVAPAPAAAGDGQAQADNSGDGATGSAGSGTGAAGPGTTVTASSTPPEDPHNAVYVLQEQDGVLEIVGSVEDIAPNENLYAARFIGTRGFLVTFQQIDPLSVLDLSDPTDPKLVGELKIPGYSDYLHPFGDNLLIGVGRSTVQFPEGFTEPGGVQLSLFDVSDLANPTLIQQLTVGGYGSQSDVSYTHKAFTFLPDRGLLAIPGVLMSEQGDPWSGGYSWQPEFDGVLCFNVDATGFTELGRVSSVIYDELGWTEWRRGAFIGDTVYAVTPAGIRAASLTDFTQPDKLVLTPNDNEVGGGGGETSPGSPGSAPPATPM